MSLCDCDLSNALLGFSVAGMKPEIGWCIFVCWGQNKPIDSFIH